MAAVILETVTGTNGSSSRPTATCQLIRQVCDRHGILLIADEVMAGFGRTGNWFAVEHLGVVPDIMTLAKGINSGYVPLGAMVVSAGDRRLGAPALLRRRPDLLGPPARLRRGGRVDRGLPGGGHRRERGRVSARCFRVRARTPRREAPVVGEVRGWAASWASSSSRIGRPASRSCRSTARARRPCRWRAMAARALANGLYLMTHWNVVMVCPPLTITRDELGRGSRCSTTLSRRRRFVD